MSRTSPVERHAVIHFWLHGHWKELANLYIRELNLSGMAQCSAETLIGIKYYHHAERQELEDILQQGLPSHRVIYARHLDADHPTASFQLPIRDDAGRALSSPIDLCEMETLLALVNHARSSHPETVYHVFHTKGLTHPPLDPGRVHQYALVAQWLGLPMPLTGQEANGLMTRAAITCLRHWRDAEAIAMASDVYYFIWNFFSARADLLSSFSWQKWFDAASLAR